MVPLVWCQTTPHEGAAREVRTVHTVHQGMCTAACMGPDAHVALHATTSIRFKTRGYVLHHGVQPRMLEGRSVRG